MWQQADRIKVFADIWGGFEKLFVADRIKVVGWGEKVFLSRQRMGREVEHDDSLSLSVMGLSTSLRNISTTKRRFHWKPLEMLEEKSTQVY